MAPKLSGEHSPFHALLEGSDCDCGGDSFRSHKVSEAAEIQVDRTLLAVALFQTSPQPAERTYRPLSSSCLRPPSKCRFVVETQLTLHRRLTSSFLSSPFVVGTQADQDSFEEKVRHQARGSSTRPWKDRLSTVCLIVRLRFISISRPINMCCPVDDVPRSHGDSTTKRGRLRELGNSFKARKGRQRRLHGRSGHPLFRRCQTDPVISHVSDHKTDSKKTASTACIDWAYPGLGCFEFADRARM